MIPGGPPKPKPKKRGGKKGGKKGGVSPFDPNYRGRGAYSPPATTRSDAAQGNSTYEGYRNRGGQGSRSDAAQGVGARERRDIRRAARGRSDAAQGNATNTPEIQVVKQSREYQKALTEARRALIRRSIARHQPIPQSRRGVATTGRLPDDWQAKLASEATKFFRGGFTVSTGGGPGIYRPGGGGLGGRFATVTPPAERLGNDKFGRKVGADLGAIATGPIVAGLTYGAAGVQAAQGNFDPAEQIAKDTYEQYKEIATHPIRSLQEHPIITPLAVGGATSVAGRLAGAGIRAAGSTTSATGLRGSLARAGSTVRPPIAIIDDAGAVRDGKGIVERTYSKDLTRKAIQVAIDKRRKPVLDPETQEPVTVPQRGREVPVYKATETELNTGIFVNRAGLGGQQADFEAARANSLERANREKISKELKLSGVKGNKAKDLVTLVVRGTIRDEKTFRSDAGAAADRLEGEYHQRLADPEDPGYRHSAEAAQTQRTVELLRQAENNPRVYGQAGKIVSEGKRIGAKLNEVEEDVLHHGVLSNRDRAERARLIEYAVEHLGAKHYTKKQHADLENAARAEERAAKGDLEQARKAGDQEAIAAAEAAFEHARENRIAVSGRNPEGVRQHEAAKADVKTSGERLGKAEQNVRKAERRVTRLEGGAQVRRGSEAAERMRHGRAAPNRGTAIGRYIDDVLANEERMKKGAADERRTARAIKAAKADLKQAKRVRDAAAKEHKEAKKVAKGSPLPKRKAALRTAEGRHLPTEEIRASLTGERPTVRTRSSRSAREVLRDTIVTPTERGRAAMREYRSTKFLAIQGLLRGRNADVPLNWERINARRDEYMGIARDLDAEIGRQKPLSEDVTLYRGLDVRGIGVDPSTLRPGKVVTDKGFASVTTERKFTKEFQGRGGVTLDIDVPAGSRILFPDEGREREAILPRGAKFRITERTDNPDGSIALRATLEEPKRFVDKPTVTRDPDTIAYLPDTSRGSRAFHAQYRPGTRPVIDKPGTRTGEQYRKGAIETSHELLREQGVRLQTQLTKAKQLDRFMQESGLARPDGRYWTMEDAVEFAQRVEFDTRDGMSTSPYVLTMRNGQKMVAVRAHGAKLSASTKQTIQDNLQAPGHMESLHARILNDRIVRPDPETGKIPNAGAENVLLVPLTKLAQLEKHLAPHSSIEKALQLVNRPFRLTVLPQPRWLSGNAGEGTLRLTLDGSGLNVFGLALDLRAATVAVRALERGGDPRKVHAAAEIRAQMFGGLLVGRAQRGSIHRGLADFPKVEKVYGKMVSQLPATKNAAEMLGTFGHRAVTLQRVIIDVNRMVEGQLQRAAFGRQVRKDLQEFSGSWLKTVRLQERAVAEATAGLVNTATQHRFMKAQHVLLGKYDGYGPVLRRLIAGPMPFLPWALNAARFIFWTLPAHHTAVESVMLMTHQAVGQAWEDDHADVPPGSLKFAIRNGKGGWIDLARYTPFGLTSEGNPLNTLVNQFLPQAHGVVNAIAGKDPFGRELQFDPTENPNPTEGGSAWQRAGQAALSAGESVIPFLGQARRLQEGGGTAYAGSTVLDPDVKPGTRGRVSPITKVFSPISPTYLGPGGGGKSLLPERGPEDTLEPLTEDDAFWDNVAKDDAAAAATQSEDEEFWENLARQP